MASCTSIMPLAAQEDPFAIYHQALENRLAAMSQTPVWVPPKAPEVPPSLERKIAPPIAAALSSLERYRPMLESILELEGLPKSLIAVALVESGGQPLALSPKQARGLWQFIPATARQYGLTVTADQDDRVHVAQSTRAAARYLRDLYREFGDWPLALAAYNAGPDAVKRALQRGHATTFAEISAARLLPEETRHYVPAVLAAIELTKYRQLGAAISRAQIRQPSVPTVPSPAN